MTRPYGTQDTRERLRREIENGLPGGGSDPLVDVLVKVFSIGVAAGVRPELAKQYPDPVELELHVSLRTGEALAVALTTKSSELRALLDALEGEL